MTDANKIVSSQEAWIMTFLQLAEKRYSVKSFKDQKVEEDKLQKILLAGKLAPTAKNNQPQKIYIIQSEEGLKKINELSPCIYGAKTVFLLGYDSTLEWNSIFEEGVHSGVEDISIVATHMMLEAADLGVGTCWVNYFPNTKTRDAFNLPETFVPVLLMPVGYPDEKGIPLLNHTKFRDDSEMIEYL